MHVNPNDLAILAGAILPLMVAAITRFQAPPWAKSYLLIAMTAISAAVSQVVADNGTFTFKGVLMQFAKIFVVAIASLYGVYKPVGLADKIKVKTKNVGVGPIDLTLPHPGE